MTLDEFAEMVARHDLTYDYSDDYSVVSRGRTQRAKILDAAKEFPIDDVARIWNASVDKKLRAGFRNSFYWSESLVDGKWVFDPNFAKPKDGNAEDAADEN